MQYRTNLFVSIIKTRKIKLVDVSLLSNCTNFIKPKTKIKWVNEYDKEIKKKMENQKI